MTTVWALVRREVYGYFASPIAYVVLALFLFLYGLYFYGELEIFLDPRNAQGQTMNVNQDMIRWLFNTTAVIVMFVLPLVTMRSFSEELRSGTIELLFTSPLTDSQLVLGKFLGALVLYAVMLGTTLLHMGLLFYFGDPEWIPIAIGYLGMLLLGSAYIAFGLVFSSMTKNQVVAGFLSFGVFLTLYLIEIAQNWGGLAQALVPYLSVGRHLEEFAKGVIDSRDVVYYLSFIALGLFLTKQSIESYRWRG
jgi:ABC-2 type transport system permease protein